MKQYAPACERNQMFILEVLRRILPDRGLVLEVGSGTGQHAACFAPEFSNLEWQPTDIGKSLDSIAAWREEAKVPNLLPPLELDLSQSQWPVNHADVVVCINTVHIVSWPLVGNLFDGASRILPAGGVLYLYGPFRYANRPLEPSNISFDQWLKARDPDSGIRQFEDVNELAVNCGFKLIDDIAMPANNRSIWWRKI